MTDQMEDMPVGDMTKLGEGTVMGYEMDTMPDEEEMGISAKMQTMSDEETVMADEIDFMPDEEKMATRGEMETMSDVEMIMASEVELMPDEEMAMRGAIDLMPGEDTTTAGEKQAVELTGAWRLTLSIDSLMGIRLS